MLKLVQSRLEPAQRPMRRVSGPRLVPIEVPAPRFRVTEEEPHGMKVARRALRLGVVVGSLTAAWQIGMVIGAL
ncbi:MAG: hypothetical protein ACHQU1_07245 [Gemmatimonadales bacterium]